MNHVPTASVYLYIWGDDLIPANISKILEIESTSAKVKGEKKYSEKSQKTTIAKTGVWTLCVSKTLNTEDVNKQMEFIINHLNSRKIKVGQIEGAQKACLCIFAFLDEEDGVSSIEFDISTEMLQKLSELELPLNFTFG